MFLPHLAARLYGTPLLLARSKLDIILNVLGSRIDWTPGEAQPSTAPENPPFTTRLARSNPASLLELGPNLASAASGIAVIGISGSLVRRSIGIDAQSGLTSYAEIGQKLELAAADPSISGILLDIDSPGGEAGGVFELAQRIREIDAAKPVWALASDSALSAAYALACAASRVLVTQTSALGSIGVLAMHVDQSARDIQQGYRFTAVTAGEFKADLSPHEPLNPGSTARLQAEVDRLYGLFVDHVAGMRTLTPKAVRATQAACFFGPNAVEVGLADAMVRSDQLLGEFAAFLARPSVHALFSASVQPMAPVSNPNPKESLMTQDLQPKPAPHPASASASTSTCTSVDRPNQDDLLSNQPPAADTDPAQVEGVAPPQPPQSDAPISDAGSASEVQAQAVEIAQLCQLAGQTTRIAGFLAQGLTATQVRQALLLARSQSEEIASLIQPEATGPRVNAPHDGARAMLAAVKRLNGTP